MKIKSRYFQVFFGQRIELPREVEVFSKSRKVKDFQLSILNYKSGLIKERSNDVTTTKKNSV